MNNNHQNRIVLFRCAIYLLTVITVMSHIFLRNPGNGWSNLSFFTVQSNLLAFFFYSRFLPDTINEKKRNTPLFPFVVLCLLVTSVVFQVFLLLDPTTRQTYLPMRYDCILAHYIVPTLVLFDYVFFEESCRIPWYAPIIWSLYPCLYYITLMVSLLFETGITFPYDILDASRHGLKVLFPASVLLAFFLSAGYLLWFADLPSEQTVPESDAPYTVPEIETKVSKSTE